MRFTSIAGLEFCLALCWLAASPGMALAADATCTMDTVETTPEAVIEPCTRLIADSHLSQNDRATAFYLRARGYHRTGRLEPAAQDYDVAIKLAPDRADPYVHRANIEYRQQRFKAHYADLMQALTLDPRNATAFRMLGTLYQDRNDTEKAVDFFSQALAIDPAEPYALLFRSSAFVQLHRFDDALRDATTLVDIPAAVINRLGYVNEHAKMQDFHVVALTHRAQLNVKLGRQTEAEQDFDAAVAAKWSPEALTPRGEYRLAQPAQTEAALKDLEESARMDPDDYATQYDRGMALLRLKRFDSALYAFGRAAELQPKTGPAVRMRALVYREMGQTDDAVRELEKAAALDPRIAAITHDAFVAAGYLTDERTKPVSPADLHAATQACMLDTTCN